MRLVTIGAIRRQLALIAILVAASPLQVNAAGADVDGGSSGAGGDVDGAIFAAWANSYDVNANFPRSRGRLCIYRPILNVDPVAKVTPWGQWTWTTTSGIVVLTWWRSCDTDDDGVLDADERAHEDYYAQFVTIGTDILLDVLRDQEIGEIDVPVPDLSPPDTGYINLGLWLAIEDVTVPEVSASSGPNWARVWVEVDGTTYDFGNGESRHCPGIGSPIPDHKKDSTEQGPCGYTYADATGDYTITVTATWNVWAETSSLPPYVVQTVEQNAAVPYPVLEIQTVGTG